MLHHLQARKNDKVIKSLEALIQHKKVTLK